MEYIHNKDLITSIKVAGIAKNQLVPTSPSERHLSRKNYYTKDPTIKNNRYNTAALRMKVKIPVATIVHTSEDTSLLNNG